MSPAPLHWSCRKWSARGGRAEYLEWCGSRQIYRLHRLPFPSTAILSFAIKRSLELERTMASEYDNKRKTFHHLESDISSLQKILQRLRRTIPPKSNLKSF